MRVNSFAPGIDIFEKNMENKEEKIQGTFKEKLDQLNEKQIIADEAVKGFINGELEVHEMMLATEEAKMSLQLAVQVRNKIVEAVQELTRMQL